MAENDIMLAEDEDDVEYTIIDVINAAKDMGLNSINVQTLRNFLILNDDYFDSYDYADFIDIINEIRDLYYNPVAEVLFGKTADKLTDSERYDVIDAMSNEDRRSILDAHIEAMRDRGIVASMAIDAKGHVVWYWKVREESDSTGSISYYTEHGTRPDPVEGLAVTEEHLPTITADGYVHTGWVDYIGDPVNVGDTFEYSPTLIAVWEEAPTTVDYTITYETAQGTAPASKTVTVNYGESYALTAEDLPAIVYSQYDFAWWGTAQYHGEKIEVGHQISGDTTLYAVWSTAITLTYHTERGETPAPTNLTVYSSYFFETICPTLPILETEGYIFKGWQNKSGDAVTAGGSIVSADTDLYAVWERDPAAGYILSYVTAHGIAPESKFVGGEHYALTADDLPTLEADGYIFGGWAVNGEIVSAGYAVSADTVLTAVWVQEPDKPDEPSEPTEPISFIEYLVNPKYHMEKPFRGLIGWKLAQKGGGVDGEPALVSSDGYTLQDVNGLNLIPKEDE